MPNIQNTQPFTFLNFPLLSPANPQLMQSSQHSSQPDWSHLSHQIGSLPLNISPAVPETPKGQGKENKPSSNHPSESASRSSAFTNAFVEQRFVAQLSGISTHVRKRGVGNVFAESSPSLYLPYRYFVCHSFDHGCFHKDSAGNLPSLIHVHVQVLDATTKQEVLKNGRPILTGELETVIRLQRPVDCNSVGAKLIEHEEKFQLLDCSYHHSNKQFVLCVSYRLSRDGKPFLVRHSPQFRSIARAASTGGCKRKRSVSNEEIEIENEIEAKRQRDSPKAVPMSSSNTAPPAAAPRLPVVAPVPLPSIVNTGNKALTANGYTHLEQSKTVGPQLVYLSYESVMAKFAELMSITQKLQEDEKKRAFGSMTKTIHDLCGQKHSSSCQSTKLQDDQDSLDVDTYLQSFLHEFGVDCQQKPLESPSTNFLEPDSNLVQPDSNIMEPGFDFMDHGKGFDFL